jgi:Integrase core domain
LNTYSKRTVSAAAPGRRRLRVSDDQRRRLAVKGEVLGRRRLAGIAGIVTPDTILRWYRTLVAKKYDGSTARRPGRPRTKPDLAALVVRMANENPTWGYTRIRGGLKSLGHDIARNTIKAILQDHGVEPGDGFLRGMPYVILDRDPRYTTAFRRLLRNSGVKPLILPAWSPNLNAFAERFVESAKSECLDRLVLLGEGHLLAAVREFVQHYHEERPHQGLGNALIAPKTTVIGTGPVNCRERLGGLLKFYCRQAA